MSNTVITLSSVELVYLVQMRKQGVVIGISDPFQALSEAEKASAVAEAEDSLAGRGLLKLSFGGKASVDEELLNLLGVCTEFDHYIGFDFINEAGEGTTKRFYNKGKLWATISDAENGELLLSYIADRKVQDELAALPAADRSDAEDVNLLIQKREMNRIIRHLQAGKREQASAVLANYDFSSHSKQLLVESLEMKLPMVSLTLAESIPEGVGIDNVSVVNKDGVLAEYYQTIAEDDRTMIGLRPAQEGAYAKMKEVAEQWSTASL